MEFLVGTARADAPEHSLTLYLRGFLCRLLTSVLFTSTETLLGLPKETPELATARSSLPSQLKSPTATDRELDPAPKSTAGPKVPSPLPSSTETLFEPTLATAKSSSPSPLKSPTTTETRLDPAPKFTAAPKQPSPLPTRTQT